MTIAIADPATFVGTEAAPVKGGELEVGTGAVGAVGAAVPEETAVPVG